MFPTPSRRLARALLALCALLGSAQILTTTAQTARPGPAQFIGLTNFSSFETASNDTAPILTTPWIKFERSWDELVVSWNVTCPPGSGVKVEVRAGGGTNETPFLVYGWWSEQPERQPRESVREQAVPLARIETDTVVCRQPMERAQVRLTLQPGDDQAAPRLKFLGLSALDSLAPPAAPPPNRAVWGKTLEVPERSQLGHPGANGWCSPTSVSMVLAYWSALLHRPDLDHPVAEVARAIHDPHLPGTGNWPFNTAYAGHFESMRAYVTRLTALRDLEDWLATGVPVVVSLSFDLLNGRPRHEGNGHLVVLVGFTPTGDPVINDPWPNPKKENKVRRVFPRQNLERAWQHSHRTAYLIHPESWPVPTL